MPNLQSKVKQGERNLRDLSQRQKYLEMELAKVQNAKNIQRQNVIHAKQSIKSNRDKQILRRNRVVNNNLRNQYNYRGTMKLRKQKGYFVEYDIRPRLEVNEINIPNILELVSHLKDVGINTIKTNHSDLSSNLYWNMRLRFSARSIQHDDEGKPYYVFNICNTISGSTLTEISEKLFNITSHHSNDVEDPYILWLDEVAVFLIDRGEGGCVSREKILNKVIENNEMVKLISPKSKNNNCLFECIKKGAGSKQRMHILKKKLGLKKDEMPSLKNHLKSIVNGIKGAKKKGVVVYDGCIKPTRKDFDPLSKTYKILAEYPKNKDKPIEMVLLGNHYYLVSDISYKGKCEKCGEKRKNMKKHIEKGCHVNTMFYYQTVIKKSDILKRFPVKPDHNKGNWVFFDLETFGDRMKHNRATVYAVGWYDCFECTYYFSYGKNAMNIFMEYVLKCKDKKFIAYNGCRFDFYFLQQELLNRGMETNFFLNASRILKLDWGENNTTWDLCNFTLCSLADACKSFETNL